jgi:hypothetical protein
MFKALQARCVPLWRTIGLRAYRPTVNEKGVNGFRSSENGESLVSGGC